MQAELGKLQDAWVYMLPFPLTGLHPSAAALAESIWCASDQSVAWNSYVLNGVTPLEKSCTTPLERNQVLAAKY